MPNGTSSARAAAFGIWYSVMSLDPADDLPSASPPTRHKDEAGLTQRQRAFVAAFVQNGGMQRQAAETAGYAPGETARVHASKMLRLPHIQRALMQEVAATLGVGTVIAAAKLVKLAATAKSEFVQLEASKDILDRAGLRAPDRSIVAHKVSMDIDLT